MAAKKADAAPDTETEPAAERKPRGAGKYPPYVNAHGAIPKLFREIQKASVPPKFTQDFMETVLELKSSSHRALIPLLKRLGFIDAANGPTEQYKAYRDESQSGAVMAAQLRAAYAELYKANEYAHNLKKDELQSKLRALTGAADDDPVVGAVVGTFLELTKLADFKAQAPSKVDHRKSEDSQVDATRTGVFRESGAQLGLSYTITLNLPATTEIEVFNAIFKSLKENLLDG
jgi:hypothetical protein